ncbi:MAG: 2Fe-2S iron-sulfur cluster-binding protein [Terriglobia bacterium]
MESHKGTGAVHRVTLITPGGEHTISAASDQHLWDTAQAAGVVLPALCHQGRCLTCAGQITGPGDPGEFDQSDSESYFAADRAAGFILLCTAKARSDLRIYTHRQNEMRSHRLSLGLPAPYA